MRTDPTDRCRALSGLLLAGLLAAPVLADEPCADDFVEEGTGHPTRLELLVSTPAGDDAVDRALFEPECHAAYRLSGIASTIGIPPRLDFYLVIDRSGSTGDHSGVDLDGDGLQDSILEAEVEAARAFVDAVNLTNNRVSLISFHSTSFVQTQLGSDRAALQAGLDAILTLGPAEDTNFGAAVREAVREHDLRHDPTREQVVVFLSDGRATTQVPDPPAVGLEPCSTYEFGESGCNGILWAEHAAFTRGLRIETFAVGRFAAREILQEMAERADGRLTVIERAGDVASVLPQVNQVGVDRVVVKSLDTLEEVVADLRPDGDWSAEIELLPGDNDLVITAVADLYSEWTVSCERRVRLSCADFECPEPQRRECVDGGGLVESLRPWVSHDEIAVVSDRDEDGDGDAGGVYGMGLTVVEFVLTDVEGHTRTCTSSVEVRDTLPPEMTEPEPSLELECGEPVPAPEAVRAFDDCAGELPVAFAETETVLGCPANRDLDRRWSAEDGSGHAVEAGQRIRVRDTQPPVVQEGDEDLHCFRAANHWLLDLGPEDFSPVVTDGCSEIAAWALVGCESDQGDDDRGDGRTASDCRLSEDGARLVLRGERDGRRPEGRRYGVLVAAMDACGNWSEPARIGWVRILHDLRDGEHRCPIVSRTGRRD